MASNRNTQISPASNQLDPLASYYQYKFRYQQIAGAVNGENVDPHEDDASDVLWNLGGRLVGDRVEFPAATEGSFNNFVRSTTQSTSGLSSQFAAQQNALPYEDFVFFDGAGENSAVTTSLPNKFAAALLFSSQKIVDELVEGVNSRGAFEALQLVTDPQIYEPNELQEHLRNIPTNSFAVRRFIDRLYRHLPEENRTNLYDRFSGDIDGSGPQRRVKDGTAPDFGLADRVTENFLDVIHYQLLGLGLRARGDQGQYQDDNPETVTQLYYFRVIQALLPEIPKVYVKQVLTTVTMPKNTCIRYQSDSAFVRTQHTYQEWDSDAFTGMAGDYTRPRYNFYVPGYERLISGSAGEGIPETALPNSYIRNLYFRQPNTEYLPQITAQATLDSKIPVRSTKGLAFYSTYAEAVPTANQNQVDTAAELGSFLLVPSNAGNFLEAYRGIPAPMSIEVAFRRSTWDSTAQDMNDRGTSLPILRLLGECYGSPFQPPAELPNKESQRLVYTSKFISGENGVQSMIPTTENFDVFNARSVFRQPFSGAPLDRKFVVLSENPAGTEVHQRFENGVPLRQTIADDEKSLATAQVMEAKAARNADRAYTRILNGEAVPSVALAYGLTKKTKDDNVILQTVMFGNGAGSLNTSYYDTQIKYNTEYVYELDEFSLVYSPEYSVGITCPNYPIWLMEQYLDIGNSGYLEVWTGDTLTPQERSPELLFEMFVKEYPAPKIVRLPVHDRRESEDFTYGGSDSGLLGTFYPPTKVMDRPPSPPYLEMLPLRGVDSQIKVHVNTNAGSFIGDNALEAVAIGGRESEFAELYRYQKEYLNFELPEGFLEFQPEGRGEIRNISLYRTTAIDLDVDKYSDIYKSFNEADPTVTVRRYTTDPSDILEENIGIQELLSYDITDNILPNVNYFYTCTIEDHHGHVSNPSAIFRVRLVSDKGLMIPEIDSVVPKRRRPQTPTKDLTRYLQIDASNIQSFPYFEMGSDGNIIAAPNIASHLGKSLEDKAFIVRLTSKDTGRIFDIKIDFEVKYGDEEEEERDDQPDQQAGGRPVSDPPPVEEQAQDEEEEQPVQPGHPDWDDMQRQHNEQQEQEEEEEEDDDSINDGIDYEGL